MYYTRTPMQSAGKFYERGEVMPEPVITSSKVANNIRLLIEQRRLVILDSSNKKHVTNCDGCGKKFANLTFVHAHRALKACGVPQDALMDDPNQAASDREISELLEMGYDKEKQEPHPMPQVTSKPAAKKRGRPRGSKNKTKT